MRARNKLNVKQIASLAKVGVHSDGGGLYLRVRETGSRSWLFIYTFGGKRREMGLGSDLDVSLAKAREKAGEARALLLEGKDPQVERARITAPTQPVVTFESFALKWLDSVEDGFSNAKHRQQWRNTLKTYAAPLFPLPVKEVTTEAVLEVLKPIWLSKAETASRVRSRIERVLDAAKANGLREGENPARSRGHLDLLLPRRAKAEVKHHAALPFSQIADFMSQLRTRPAMAARALEFTVLTAARSGETRGMTWGEVDLDQRLWTVPGSRMKAGATHQVPLSDAALAVLSAVKPTKIALQALVFPAQRGGAMSDMAMPQLLKRMERLGITVQQRRFTSNSTSSPTNRKPEAFVTPQRSNSFRSCFI
jgi:integrase